MQVFFFSKEIYVLNTTKENRGKMEWKEPRARVLRIPANDAQQTKRGEVRTAGYTTEIHRS
jgi:hypothetical protein